MFVENVFHVHKAHTHMEEMARRRRELIGSSDTESRYTMEVGDVAVRVAAMLTKN